MSKALALLTLVFAAAYVIERTSAFDLPGVRGDYVAACVLAIVLARVARIREAALV